MRTKITERILSETPQETKDKVKKCADEKIPKPIRDFIIENAIGVQGADGAYYHYTEVIKLLRLIQQANEKQNN